MGIKFNPNGFFFRVMTTLGSLVFYNLLWLLFCIPIFTIGAATTALLSAQFDLLRASGPSGFKCFWTHFRRVFRPATAVWLIMLAVLLFLAVDYSAIANMPALLQQPLLIFCHIFAAAFSLISAFLFPLISQRQLSGKPLFSVALRCCIAYFPRTIGLVLLTAVPILFFAFFPPALVLASVPVWLFVGFSALSNLSARLLLPVFFPEERDK